MLTQARYDSKLASVSAMARKVLEFVPIQEVWTRAQVRTAMHHTTRASVDPRVIDGCISQLVEVGLVRVVGDRYQQVRPHEKPATTILMAPARAQECAEPRKPTPHHTPDTDMPKDQEPQPLNGANLNETASILAERLRDMRGVLDDQHKAIVGLDENLKAAIEEAHQLEALIAGLRQQLTRFESLKALLRDIDQS